MAEKIIGAIGVTILLLQFRFCKWRWSCLIKIIICRCKGRGVSNVSLQNSSKVCNSQFGCNYLCLTNIYSSVSGGFKQLAILAGEALHHIYLSVISALIKLRTKKDVDAEKSFMVPGGLLIPVFAIASIIWVILKLNILEIVSMIIFVAVLCVIYLAMELEKQIKE